MTLPFDVAIIGGGAVGAACARELALDGRRVVIVEQGGDRGQAWKAAAGMLAPQIETGPDDPAMELGLAGRELYSSLAEALRETTGLDVGLWRDGIAWVAGDEVEAGELRSRVAWQRQQSQVSDWLDAEEVNSRWPWLGPTAGALWAPHEGAVDPAMLVRALLADAVRAGAVVVDDTVISVDHRGDRVVGLVGLKGRYPAADIVMAAGAWSGTIEGVPRPIAVAPVRGQMAAFPWPDGARPAIVYGHGCYMLARGNEAIVGSTMEYVGFHPDVSPAGLAKVFTGASLLCPTLDRTAVRRTWAGLRPVTPDGLPIIGAEPRLQGLWYATGHGRNGILLAGITGVIIRRLLSGEQPEEDLQAFLPGRFWSW